MLLPKPAFKVSAVQKLERKWLTLTTVIQTETASCGEGSGRVIDLAAVFWQKIIGHCHAALASQDMKHKPELDFNSINFLAPGVMAD